MKFSDFMEGRLITLHGKVPILQVFLRLGAEGLGGKLDRAATAPPRP